MKKENKWVSNLLDIGTIKAGKKVKFNFVSNVELDISYIKAGCSSCTTFKPYDKEKKILPVIFRAEEVPLHLKSEQKNHHEVRKSIIVYYKDSTKETLEFKGRVV